MTHCPFLTHDSLVKAREDRGVPSLLYVSGPVGDTGPERIHRGRAPVSDIDTPVLPHCSVSVCVRTTTVPSTDPVHEAPGVTQAPFLLQVSEGLFAGGDLVGGRGGTGDTFSTHVPSLLGLNTGRRPDRREGRDWSSTSSARRGKGPWVLPSVGTDRRPSVPGTKDTGSTLSLRFRNGAVLPRSTVLPMSGPSRPRR